MTSFVDVFDDFRTFSTYIKGSMGKPPKLNIFGNFGPVNLKSGKNDIAYLDCNTVLGIPSGHRLAYS